MKTIQSYYLPVQDTEKSVITIPIMAQILSVNWRGSNGLHLYAIVDLDLEKTERTFFSYCTEQEIPEKTDSGLSLKFIGTVYYVVNWHIFEEVRNDG